MLVGHEVQRNNWDIRLDIICRLEMLESLDLDFCGSVSFMKTRAQQSQSRECFRNLKRLDLQCTYLRIEDSEANLFALSPSLECVKFGSLGREIIVEVLGDLQTITFFSK